MKSRLVIGAIVLGVVLVGVLVWALTAGVERLVPARRADQTPAQTTTAAPTPNITATLFYGSSDGLSLVPVRREVPLAEGIVAQGANILNAQFEAPPSPHLSVVPKGTKLRAFFVTDRGEAFVDLSAEITTAHPGGSMTELLTVTAIVNAVTANLPAVERVQILVEGKEVDTIAGHVDVRRPLTGDAGALKEK